MIAERKARESIREHLAQENQRPTLELVREWFAGIDLDEWHREVVEAGADRSLYAMGPDTRTGIQQYPSSWVFTAYRLARLVFTLGEGRKIQESDLPDGHHAACGVYCDTLVTDDAQFLATLDLLGSALPFRWERSADFAARLRDLV